MNIVPQSQSSQMFNANKPTTKGSYNFSAFLFTFKSVNLLILLALLFIIYLFYNPPFLAEQNRNRELVSDVEKLTDVPQGQTPLIAQVTDAEALRSENQFQAEIYANATNGDYVFGYGDRMIIFRESSKAIIYDGPVPQRKIQEEIIGNIVNSAAGQGVSVSTDDQVQLSVVENPQQLQGSGSEFYQFAVQGDIVAIFPDKNIIMIYRPSESRIIKTGSINISIQ